MAVRLDDGKNINVKGRGDCKNLSRKAVDTLLLPEPDLPGP